MLCVAQGITYVGGAVGGLRVMAARAEMKRTVKQSAKDGELATAVPKGSSDTA